MSDRITIQIDQHVADVRLNRPDKMNALDEEMFQAIIAAGKSLTENAEVRCVVLSGAGKAFCAGLDLSNFDLNNAAGLAGSKLLERTHGIANKWQQVAWQWRELPVPVIAAVHGVAFGGGLQIMLGADIKYIAPDTKLSIMETKWGIIPDMAGTQLMRHSIREDIIKELTYTHRIFSGTEAVQYGFATHATEDPHSAAMKLAREIASKSPDAIVTAKRVINAAPYLNPEEGLLLESQAQEKVLLKENQLEAVFAGMQKRAGKFKGFREKGAKEG